MNKELKNWEKDEVHSDEEINDLADWCESLTIQQLLFIRDLYQMNLQSNALETGNAYVQ